VGSAHPRAPGRHPGLLPRPGRPGGDGPLVDRTGWGCSGDAAFSSSPLSGQGNGLALVGAYLLAGELAAAGWDPEYGFAGYERRMRSFVEANQEIGRLPARSRDVPGPGAEPSLAPEEWPIELVEHAINGVELPDYARVPDSGAPPGQPITSSATS